MKTNPLRLKHLILGLPTGEIKLILTLLGLVKLNCSLRFTGAFPKHEQGSSEYLM
jgi:hypothetical protein